MLQSLTTIACENSGSQSVVLDQQSKRPSYTCKFSVSLLNKEMENSKDGAQRGNLTSKKHSR